MRANIRQWTAVRWAAAVTTAAAAALAVTGCGQQQIGAAAVYGSQRISGTKLAAEVSNLNVGYQVYKGKVQIGYTPADMPRQVLSWMLRFAITEQLAARKHKRIRVTPAQARKELDALTARARQAGDTLREVTVLIGLPHDLLPGLGRWLAIQDMLASRLDHGVAPTTQAAQTALVLQANHLQCLAAKSLHIKVNPQYGALAYPTAAQPQFVVVAVPSGLSAGPGAVGVSASPAPQLTPNC